MLDGRFDPEFHRVLVEGQVSASDLARDHAVAGVHPAILRVWLAVLAAVVVLCAIRLA